MKLQIALIPAALLALGLGAAGCSKEATPEASASTAPANGSPDAVPATGAVKNSPDASAAPGAAYRIVPPNPNDPKFKPDPKLGGGG